MRRLLPSAALLLLLLPALAGAQRFDFSIRNIMRGPELYGREPTNVRWTPDGQWIYFNWLPAGTDWRDQLRPFRVRAKAGAAPESLSDAQMDSAGPLLVSEAPLPMTRAASWNTAATCSWSISAGIRHARSPRRSRWKPTRAGRPTDSA